MALIQGFQEDTISNPTNSQDESFNPNYREGAEPEERAVLLVDDEEHILSSLRRLLRKEPYKVHIAVGGLAGLEVLKENRVQLIVSDQRMPGMEGTEFLAKVKDLYPDTVRVVLSGYADTQAIVKSINMGEVYRFLGKPWEDDNLKATILQCFEQYDIVQENQWLNKQNVFQMEQLRTLNSLLEASVEERTQELQLSQEILEVLPVSVIGISQEGEIITTNSNSRTELEALRNMIPGTEIEEIFPPKAAISIRTILDSGQFIPFEFNWNEMAFLAKPARLGSPEAHRGCILVIEEVK